MNKIILLFHKRNYQILLNDSLTKLMISYPSVELYDGEP